MWEKIDETKVRMTDADVLERRDAALLRPDCGCSCHLTDCGLKITKV